MAAIALFTMTSCSSDDDSSQTTASNLIKKTVMTGDGEQLVTNYNYNGNKIVSTIASDGSASYYTYTGDLITEMKYYEGEELFQTEVYTYTNDNKLATHTMYLNTQDYTTRGEFTYNANNTVTINYFSGDLESQTTPSNVYTLTIVNENITQVNIGSTIRTATYDTGLDPM